MCPVCHKTYLFSQSNRPCGKCQRRSKRNRAGRELVRGNAMRWKQIIDEPIRPGELDGF